MQLFLLKHKTTPDSLYRKNVSVCRVRSRPIKFCLYYLLKLFIQRRVFFAMLLSVRITLLFCPSTVTVVVTYADGATLYFIVFPFKRTEPKPSEI